MRLSVVVPTRDRPDMLERCLQSICDSVGPDDEVIVADTSRVPLTDLAEKFDARYVRCEQPGASRARNRGWRVANSPLVAFVDDDIWVAPDWADAVVASAAAHPDAAWFTARIDVPEGQAFWQAVTVISWDDPAVIDLATEHGHFGHSANLVVRASALEEVGGFDEILGASGRLRAAEDIDLFDRLLAAGHTGWYEPTARSWHDQWRGQFQLIRLNWNYGIGAGARISKLARVPGLRRRAFDEMTWGLSVWGLKPAFDALRRRHETEGLAALARAGGHVVGFALGLTYRIDRSSNHLRASGRRASGQ